MAKNNPKIPFKKNDPYTIEKARKGGKNKKGHRSFKSVLNAMLRDGKLDEEQFVKALSLHAMKGNSGIARLIWEARDGKDKDRVEITGADGQPVEFVKIDKKQYKKIREEMLKKDDC